MLRKEGEYWTVGYAGAQFRLRDNKGLACIARLLRDPGTDSTPSTWREVTLPLPIRTDKHRLLFRSTVNSMLPAFMSPALATQATCSTGKRRWPIGAGSPSFGTSWRRPSSSDESNERSVLRREIDGLTAELSRATGWAVETGMRRPPRERARQSVTRTIKAALSKVTHENVALGQLLSRCIKTGIYCCYKPATRITHLVGSALVKPVESDPSDQKTLSGAQLKPLHFLSLDRLLTAINPVLMHRESSCPSATFSWVTLLNAALIVRVTLWRARSAADAACGLDRPAPLLARVRPSTRQFPRSARSARSIRPSCLASANSSRSSASRRR